MDQIQLRQEVVRSGLYAPREVGRLGRMLSEQNNPRFVISEDIIVDDVRLKSSAVTDVDLRNDLKPDESRDKRQPPCKWWSRRAEK